MTTLSTRVLVAGVAIVALLVSAFCVVYLGTPPSDRPELLSALGKLGPWVSTTAAGLAAILAGSAVKGNRAAAVTATHVKDKLERVEAQTNGDLDKRMAATFHKALRDSGLVPNQRVDDDTLATVEPTGEHRRPA